VPFLLKDLTASGHRLFPEDNRRRQHAQRQQVQDNP
jgi:hypothetical protein